MKQAALSFLLLLTSCFLLLTQTLAQSPTTTEFNFDRAYQDYLYNYNLYRSAYQDYLVAQNEYQKYKTLSSQTKFLETAKTMLLTRADTVKTYLTALRMKLRETTGIINYQQNLYYVKLDDEVAWVDSYKQSLPSAGSLDDLGQLSSQMEGKSNLYHYLAYKTIGVVVCARESALKEHVQDVISRLENQINQIRNEGRNTDVLERWLIEAKQKFARAEEKFTQAQNIYGSITENPSSQTNGYNSAGVALEQSNQYLKETITSLKEIIREIKNE
jgi:hypothetical protein